MQKEHDEKVLIENGVPCVKIPAALVAKYGDFLKACVALNDKLILEGSVQELEEIMVIAGRIVSLAYAILKAGEGLDCINDTPA